MPRGIYVRTEEYRRNMSLAQLGHEVSSETKRKISESEKGKIISKETRQKMSILHSGKNNPMYGIIHSKRTKKDISESLQGRILPRSVINKIRLTRINKSLNKIQSKNMKRKWKEGIYDNVSFYSSSGYREDIGHFVRSTWEANFARILKYCGIDYEYESIRFDLGDTIYTPDFKIGNKYVEIKGYDTKEAKQKRIKCREMYEIKILVIKWKRYFQLQNRFSKLILEWEI